jgi:hypothetical protein
MVRIIPDPNTRIALRGDGLGSAGPKSNEFPVRLGRRA